MENNIRIQQTLTQFIAEFGVAERSELLINSGSFQFEKTVSIMEVRVDAVGFSGRHCSENLKISNFRN